MLTTLLVLGRLVGAQHAAPLQQPTVLRAATVLDGRGGVQHNVDILVVGGRIARIGPRGPLPAGARIVDLGDRTALPGLIDAHTHPVWYFNRQNRLHTSNDGDTPVQSMLAAAGIQGGHGAVPQRLAGGIVDREQPRVARRGRHRGILVAEYYARIGARQMLRDDIAHALPGALQLLIRDEPEIAVRDGA